MSAVQLMIALRRVRLVLSGFLPCLLLWLLQPIAFAAEEPVAALLPAENWGALPAVDEVAISPDGKLIAMARNEPDGRQVLAVIDIESRKLLRGVVVSTTRREAEQSRVRKIAFATDNHLSYLMHATYTTGRGIPDEALAVGRTHIDYLRTGIIDVATGDSRLITLDERKDWGIAFTDLIAPIPGMNGIGRMAIHSSPYTDRVLNVYDVTLGSGRVRRYRAGHPDTEAWAFDARGEPVARLDIRHATNTWTLYAIDGRRETVVFSDVSQTGLSGFSGLLENGHYAFLGDELGNRPRNVLFSKQAGVDDPVIVLEHPSLDVSEVITDPWRHSVIGGVIVDALPEQHFIDPELASMHQTLRSQMPDARIEITGWSTDRRRLIVHLETAGDPGGFFLYEPAQAKLGRLSTSWPGIKGDAIGERLQISYPARDGTRIPAYITRPAHYEEGALATVVLVHGGPVARDTLAFDWWASFLASRGYLVVQPNYRGSDGYGKSYREAGHSEWGKLMQDDVEDAVHALVKAGMIDPQRVCIAGASYGGYATLVGATRTPDLYRCAISVAGVSDLPRMLEVTQKSSGKTHAVVDWWRLLIGDLQTNRPAIEAVSPVYQAERARAPILLIHGANDTVVPIEQSERMDAALRKAGKAVEFIRYPGEDHWLSDAETRIAMLKEMERFLAAHIGSEAPMNSGDDTQR